MTRSTAFPPAPPPRGLKRALGPRLGLPLMLLGLAALVPGRLASLVPQGGAASGGVSAGMSQGATLVLPLVPPLAAPIALRDGVVARPVIAPVLAGPLPAALTAPALTTPARANPLGEERPADGRLLLEVARRQSEMDRRERAIEAREAQLQAAEGMARNQIAELTRLRQEMERMVAKESTAAEGDLDALVSLYVNMRPQQAAKVLERLEAPRAAVILLKIPDRQAGPILAQMEPPAALAVTQEIAGRREAFRSPTP